MKEMWISYYTQDGRQGGTTVQAKDYDDAERILTDTIENFGGIADYGYYDEEVALCGR